VFASVVVKTWRCKSAWSVLSLKMMKVLFVLSLSLAVAAALTCDKPETLTTDTCAKCVERYVRVGHCAWNGQ